MLRAYKYRLYPTAEQRDFLTRQFGNVRRVYNLALDMRYMFWNGAEQSVSRLATQAQLVEWKEMYPYLTLSNSQFLQYAVKHVDDAFMNCWKHWARHPMPKRKRDRQSFHNPQHCSVDRNGKTLTIPKCKDIPIVLHRPFYGNIKDVTDSLNPTGGHPGSDTCGLSSCGRPPACRPKKQWQRRIYIGNYIPVNYIIQIVSESERFSDIFFKPLR